MKDGQPQAIRLDEYQASAYTTEAVDLVFDIEDGTTTVTSTLQVRRVDESATELSLDGQELELVSVRIDGQLLTSNEYTVDEEHLVLPNLAAQHEIQIVTRIHPETNTALEGLYRSSQMYCTQCEAEGFRKMTYYQDRPDVLARFTTTVIADGARYPTLLSNGNQVAVKQDNGRKAVTWEDPFPKPSYLFALVAGDLAMIEDRFTTMSGRNVALQIYSEPHNINQCDYAMDVLKRAMAWDEQQYGREYDLDIFMIVAVEDFNMGAMENKGLNIFNTSCVLATPDTATDAAYLRVEAVVAHEYFHNWSGNRVTCRDWFQLSLKEGFTVFRDAQFSADMNSAPVKRIEDVTFLRAVQFAEDASPLAHPVRPQSYIEISNFYTTTIYEKGAEVVGMYHTLLGADRFRAGSDQYFATHDGSAATTNDFMAAMAQAGGLDLKQFERWYEQAGTPVLSVTETQEGDTFTLRVEQSCPPTPEQPTKLPFHIPVVLGLIDGAGENIDVRALDPQSSAQLEIREAGQSLLVQVTEPVTEITFGPLAEKPIVSFLRNFSAPVRVVYSRPDSELERLAQYDSDGFVRWDALQTLWMKLFASPTLDANAMMSTVGRIAQQALDLKSAEDKMLATTMLSMPEENYLFEQLSGFVVEDVLARHESLFEQISMQHGGLWAELYDRYRSSDPFLPDAQGMADRGLANLAFTYLAFSMQDQARLAQLVEGHYQTANNLTDRRAALSVACRHPLLDRAVRDTLLNDFYARWEAEALVLDMWFGLQASSPLTDVAQIKQLEQHARFDLKTPNRVRSLYATFANLNHANFHHRDGTGYAYLAGAIKRLDKSNPQLAARLATPLARWQRYDADRQQIMKRNLQDLLDSGPLSKDLYEIVTKSLA